MAVVEQRARFPHERQQQMINLILARRRIGTAELAATLSISLPTARRDLLTLEQAGLVQRIHGGVTLRGGDKDSDAEPLFLEKLRVRQNLKLRIADAAAAEVTNRAVVLLDSGTTTMAIARALAGRPVTIVTSDLKAAEAAANGATEVHIIGGKVRNGYYSLVGNWALNALASIRADIFFLAADAVDADGVTTSTFEEAEVKRAAQAQAKRTILVADSGKIGASAFAAVCPLETIDLFISDRGADAPLAPFKDKFREVRLV